MMSSYSTQFYSPSGFKKALLNQQKSKHIEVNLNQINKISLEDENSVLGMNMHYSQFYEEDPINKHSLIKCPIESSPFCDPKEFDEEINVNECNLKPKADTLFWDGENREENLHLPGIEHLLKAKNFTENSIEEESIKTFTSPCFQTARIGTNGRNNSLHGDNVDVNAQLAQIQISSYLKTLQPGHSNNENKILNELQDENISEKITNTNRSSYRSLTQIELVSKKNTLNLEKNNNNDPFSQKKFIGDDNKFIDVNFLPFESNTDRFMKKMDELIEKERKFTSESYESLVLNSPHNLNSESCFSQPYSAPYSNITPLENANALKKITELNEETEVKTFPNYMITTTENFMTLPSEKIELNDKPTVFSNNKNFTSTEKTDYNSNLEKKEISSVTENMNTEIVFLNTEMENNSKKTIENDPILVYTTENEPILITNEESSSCQQEKKINENEKLLKFKSHFEAIKKENVSSSKSNLNFSSESSSHVNKIANSFKEIAATITETLNRHKKEMEKECDMDFFKNFLEKVNENGDERLARKLLKAENFYEPQENMDFYYCKTPNPIAFHKEKFFSNIIPKKNSPQNMFAFTPINKPNFEKLTPSNDFNQFLPSNAGYQSPDAFNHMKKMDFFTSSKRNLSCTKPKGNLDPNIKIRSKSCEKPKNNYKRMKTDDFQSYVKMQNSKMNNLQKDHRSFLKRVDQDLKKRKMQSFKNEIKKKSKFIEEIQNLEELNNSKGKLTKNASQNLISKLMQDAKRRNFEIEKKIKEKNEKEIKNAIEMANTKYVNTKSQTIIKKNYSNQHLLVSTEKKPVIKNSNENLNFKKKIPKENVPNLKSHSSVKKNITESSENKTQHNLKENKNYLNVNIDPFQEFLTNYNKKFIEENSILFGQDGENSNILRDSEIQITNFSN